MANRNTRAIEALELEKTLTVNNTTYNINAVHSDVADTAASASTADLAKKVDKKLTINSYTKSGKTSTSYDGASAVSVDIVPAQGGAFQGTITVPSIDLATSAGSEVISYSQIKGIIELLTGSPLYSWNGSELVNQTLADGSTIQKLSVITGKYNDFDALASSNKCPEALLYISTDAHGEIILKTATVGKTIVARNATYLEGSTADKSYTGDSLYSALSTINNRVAATEQGITANSKNISANTTAINDIKDGKITVGKATTAESAGSATKATQDSDGKQINYNYYRSTFNTKASNSITISTSAPSGGTDGDIWIKYS